MIIAVNGQLIEEGNAVISAYDHGFLYGIGFFETFRTYAGKPFMLDEHLSRLEQALQELWIDYHPDAGHIRRLVERLLVDNRLTDGYFRLSVSAGEEALGLPAGRYGKPAEILYVKALPAANEALYERGKQLQLLQLTRNTPEGAVRFKSFHYMNNILAKREMSGYPWAAGAEGLFLTADGHVAEGVVSNVFMVRGDVCMTPSIETGILPGITRSCILRLAEQKGFRTEEGFYTWDDLCHADECFVTNSIQEVVPITSIFDKQGAERIVGDGKPGPAARLLLNEYRALCAG